MIHKLFIAYLECLTNKLLVKTKRGGFDILDDNGSIIDTGSNKGILLFTRRAILRVGMLLRDSEVAKEVRTYLLNVEHDTQEKMPEIIDDITEEINEEQSVWGVVS